MMQVDERQPTPCVCGECGDPVGKPGLCVDCNTEFWQALMIEEADRHATIEEPARG